jgi:hypothetical protein
MVQGAYHASFTIGADCPLQNECKSVLEEVKKFEETKGRRPRVLDGTRQT